MSSWYQVGVRDVDCCWYSACDHQQCSTDGRVHKVGESIPEGSVYSKPVVGRPFSLIYHTLNEPIAMFSITTVTLIPNAWFYFAMQ